MEISASTFQCLYCGSAALQKSARHPYCCHACEILDGIKIKPFSQARPVIEKFKSYEDPKLSALFNLSPQYDTNTYKFFVEGLECSSCVHLLESLPNYLEDIHSSRLNFAKSELLVVTNPGLSLAAILSFIHFLGYQAIPLKDQKDLEDKQKHEDRKQLRRIAVAGAIAGNIMLFSVAIYAGARGTLARGFHWGNFILFLPVFFYCALPIYQNAWRGIKNRHLNVDVPLAFAFIASSVASTINLWRGSPGIYFDSSAGFLFLILISRWFLKNAQRRWIQSPFADLPWTQEYLNVKAGEEIQLKQNQIAPVDAVLISAHAQVDSSWMTGESLPLSLHRGMKISAGYRLLSNSAAVRAISGVQDSELSLGLHRIESESQSKSDRLSSFDQRANYLLVAVLILSGLLLAWGPTYFGLSWNQAFERSLSLLIVACPCALAFGGPLAYAMGLRKAAGQGILIKNPDILDRVLECKNLVFDKTGTLTEGRLSLNLAKSSQVPDWIKELILNLEKDSQHPVAHAFRESFKEAYRDLNVHDIHEIHGEKIYGVFNAQVYSLEKSDTDQFSLKVDLKRDGKTFAEFYFEDRLRPESKSLLEKLSHRYELKILSGDHQARVQKLIAELQVPTLSGQGDCRPMDKAGILKSSPNSMMIGDGANDSLALSAAHVGVAVQGSISQGLQASSVYFLKPGLSPLTDLLDIAAKTHKLMHRNIYFALGYNVLAGLAALTGLVGPLAAAILMPISSMIILFSTWEAGR